MGFNFDEAKKKLNLDETLEKVGQVVKDTVGQIDDVIDKGRETLTEKFDKDKGQGEQAAPETPEGEGESTDESKPDYTI